MTEKEAQEFLRFKARCDEANRRRTEFMEFERSFREGYEEGLREAVRKGYVDSFDEETRRTGYDLDLQRKFLLSGAAFLRKRLGLEEPTAGLSHHSADQLTKIVEELLSQYARCGQSLHA